MAALQLAQRGDAELGKRDFKLANSLGIVSQNPSNRMFYINREMAATVPVKVLEGIIAQICRRGNAGRSLRPGRFAGVRMREYSV